jgi:hypothetical protein
MNATQHNAATYTAGDTIVSCDTGGVFRDAILNPPTAGSLGSIISYTASGSPTFNGADLVGTWINTAADIDQNFAVSDSLTGWTVGESPPGSVVAQNNRVEVTATASGYGNFSKDPGYQGEYWAYFTIYVVSGFAMTNGDVMDGSAINDSDAGAPRVRLSITQTAGVLKWYCVYGTDGGTVDVASGVTVTTNAWYEVLMHYKKATGAGANNGMAQIWAIRSGVSTALLDVTNVDSDTTWAHDLKMGINLSPSATGTLYFGDVKYDHTYPVGLNLWRSTFSTATPNQVFFDGTRGTAQTSASSLAVTGDWYYDAVSRLYTYRATDPDLLVSPGVEASVRSYGMQAWESYLSIQGLHFTKANSNGLDITASWEGDLTGLSVTGSLSDYNYDKGFAVDTWEHNVNGVTFDSDTATYNGRWGIHFGTVSDSVTNILLKHIVAHDNGWTSTYGGGGIGAFGTGTTNCTVEQSQSYNNTNNLGIWLDTVGAGCAATQNQTSGNWRGMQIEASDGVDIYDNLSWDNIDSGFELSRRSHNNHFYNNDSWGNLIGLAVRSSAGGVPDGFTRNLLKNNILSGNTTALYAHDGGENDGTNGSRNLYQYDALGPAATNFITWGASTFSTYAAWRADPGCGATDCSYSIEADPQFTNAAGGDFSLKSTSPARHAGTNLGSSYNIGLRCEGAFPYLTTTQGGKWDIGACVKKAPVIETVQ